MNDYDILRMKVIAGLEACMDGWKTASCAGCPYDTGKNNVDCLMVHLMGDALRILKEE